MTDSEMIAMVKAMSGETDEDIVSAYLAVTGKELLRLIYPYTTEKTEVPAQYQHLQVQCAVYYLNKRGAEGETAHGENGISRTYENAGLPESIVRQIVPMCRTVG